VPTADPWIHVHDMSGTGNREAVFPTRMTLTLMKTKLKGANTGHSLLKRKSEALTKRFREITRRIDTAKRKMGRVMQIASFSLAEVTYAAGDVGYHVQESVKSARFRVRARQENVRYFVACQGNCSGVYLPTFETFTEGANDFGLTGLGRGGQQVQRYIISLVSLTSGQSRCTLKQLRLLLN
jgi:V-type H+-transporting ATPase subunit D